MGGSSSDIEQQGRGGLDLTIRFRYLNIGRGQGMDIRLIFAACIAGVVTLSLQTGFAATETRTAKPESIPPTSLKSDTPPVPAKPPGSTGDLRAGERSKSPTNGSA